MILITADLVYLYTVLITVFSKVDKVSIIVRSIRRMRKKKRPDKKRCLKRPDSVFFIVGRKTLKNVVGKLGGTKDFL